MYIKIKNNIIYFVGVCIMIIFLFTYAYTKRSIEVSLLESQNIVLEEEKLEMLCNRDAMCRKYNAQYRYLLYFDSLNCTSCIMNGLYKWNIAIEKVKYSGINVDFLS